MGILVDQYEAGASGRLLFGFQGDLLVMRVNGGTVELTSGTLNKQVWYHVMLNYIALHCISAHYIVSYAIV